MPPRLPITNEERARRHVLRQTLYRLRKRYKYLQGLGLRGNASRVRDRMVEVAMAYDAIGGKPPRTV